MPSKAISKELSALGVAQLMIGVIELTFGVPWYYITKQYYGADSATPFWTGIWFVISGALTTEMKDMSNSFKVKVVLGSNIISAFAAGVSIISYSLTFHQRRAYHWDYQPVAPVSFVLILQMFSAAELVLAVICAMLIARNLFRCCNLNAVSPQ